MDTKSTMTLAIIIPTYSNLEGLKVLLSQIIGYTTEECKIYIVDDSGKTDHHFKLFNLLQELKASSIFMVIRNPENRGITASWNNGLVQAIQDGCTHFAIFNDDIELCPKWWVECEKLFKDVHMVCCDMPCPIPLTGWFFILDKECVDKVGYFDEQFSIFGQDQDYWYRFQASGMKMAKASLPLIHHSSQTVSKLDLSGKKKEEWQKLRNKYPQIRMQV